MGSNKVPLREGVYYNPDYSRLECPTCEIHLTPNEKKMLEIILDERGRKEILIEEIWHQHGVIVSESSYHQLVKMLRRKIVAAGLNSSCLKTISRYGIIFISESDEAPALRNIPSSLHDESFQMTTLEAPRKNDNERVVNAQMSGLQPLPLGEGGKEHRVGSSGVFKNYQNFFEFKIPYWGVTLFFLFFMAIIVITLKSNNDKGRLINIKEANEVSYFSSRGMKVSEKLWQHIEKKLMPTTKVVYIESNGPKFLVAYCDGSIYKDNVPCTYEHFSTY